MNSLFKGKTEGWGLFGNRYGLGDAGNHERHAAEGVDSPFHISLIPAAWAIAFTFSGQSI